MTEAERFRRLRQENVLREQAIQDYPEARNWLSEQRGAQREQWKREKDEWGIAMDKEKRKSQLERLTFGLNRFGNAKTPEEWVNVWSEYEQRYPDHIEEDLAGMPGKPDASLFPELPQKMKAFQQELLEKYDPEAARNKLSYEAEEQRKSRAFGAEQKRKKQSFDAEQERKRKAFEAEQERKIKAFGGEEKVPDRVVKAQDFVKSLAPKMPPAIAQLLMVNPERAADPTIQSQMLTNVPPELMSSYKNAIAILEKYYQPYRYYSGNFSLR